MRCFRFCKLFLLVLINSSVVSSLNVTKARAKNLVDSETILPSYERLEKTVKPVFDAWEFAWNLTREITEDDRSNNRSKIVNVIFPNILKALHPAFIAVKKLGFGILFRRKPSGYLDALLNVTTLEQIQEMSKDPQSVPFGLIKLRWIELSSACSQMNRFYYKRMMDFMKGGAHMKEIIHSFLKYKTYAWTSKIGTAGNHNLVDYSEIPELVMRLLMFEDGSDVFQGLRNMTNAFKKVLLKNHFEAGSCEGKEEHLFIEPNGTDLPFYMLFYICLVDLKEFMIRNFIGLHDNLFFDKPFPNETDLVLQVKSRIQKKVELFDAAIGKSLVALGHMYPIRGGITLCDPPALSPTNPMRNFTLGDSYEKFTNFIKVFISPEQELHRSGTCRVTCDLLDVTYHRCGFNDTACQYTRERECLLHKGRCDKFSPPCPEGAYRCQNSTGLLSVCPSNRHDRLYEYIKGEDPTEEFHFGSKTTCENATQTYKGGWRMEEDVLLSTPHFCEICTCYCFEPLTRYLGNETTRYFSLRGVEANVKENRIVVGLKFHRVEDQIHIAIATAVALPNRNTDPSTVVWHYPEYEKDPKFVQRLDKDVRSLNLDDVVTPAWDRAVTGIRFYDEVYLGKVQYNYVGIEIRTHQLDHEGKIIPKSGIYRRNGNSTVNRIPNAYLPPPNGPDDPINANGPTLPDSTSNEYLVFVGTSLLKDAAQSTIPYFDTQKIIPPDEPTWLRGIGIIHKGRAGYGGFLGFKIIEHRFR